MHFLHDDFKSHAHADDPGIRIGNIRAFKTQFFGFVTFFAICAFDFWMDFPFLVGSIFIRLWTSMRSSVHMFKIIKKKFWYRKESNEKNRQNLQITWNQFYNDNHDVVCIEFHNIGKLNTCHLIFAFRLLFNCNSIAIIWALDPNRLLSCWNFGIF